jgi:hypothetical protein
MYPGPSNQDQDLSCLSPFVNLQNLVVNLQANIQLSPRQVALIPTWWPHIRHLDLLPSNPSQGWIPEIDHAHLLDLIRGLPLLHHLGLRFDTTRIPGQLRLEPTETFQLKTLAVGESPIVSPSRVAAFIKEHFPRLEKLDVKRQTGTEYRYTILDIRWDAVVNMLQS